MYENDSSTHKFVDEERRVTTTTLSESAPTVDAIAEVIQGGVDDEL